MLTIHSDFSRAASTSIRSAPKIAAARALMHTLLIATLFVLTAATAMAQTPAPLALPNLDLRTNGDVYAIARQADGGVVFGGDFKWVNGVGRNNIARLLPDGTLDLNWNPSANNPVRTLAVSADGSVFVGGQFNQIGGQQRRNLAKLSGLGAGLADSQWNPSPNSTVQTLVLNGNGDVFVGGDFATIGGLARSRIAKLADSGNGTVDPVWDPAANAAVSALLVADDGSLYAGGWFTAIGGQTRSRLARLSDAGMGAADPAWNPAPDNAVFALAMDDSGALFAGGQFTQIGGAARNRIAKLSSTGVADVQWNPNLSGGSPIYALAADAKGALFVGGGFTHVSGQPRNYLVKLSASATGTVYPDWNQSLAAQSKFTTQGVRALVPLSSGAIIAGGDFSQIDGDARLGLATFNASGAATTPAMDTERTGQVNALATQPDQGVIVGGNFLSADNQPRRNLLRLGADGNLDVDWNPSANGVVKALALDGNDAVFVGGEFSQVGAQARSFIAKVSGIGSGAVDPLWNPSANYDVSALVTDGNGALFAGGTFFQIGGASRNRIAKLSTNGSGLADPDWKPSPNSPVLALALNPSGALFVGGHFTQIDAVARSRIAKIATSGIGALDPDWNPTADNYVTTLAVGNNNEVFAGGEFTQIGGLARNRIAKVSASGTGLVDALWNPSANSGVTALAVDANGAVFVGGRFNQINGTTRNYLAKLSDQGAGVVDPSWRPTMNSIVNALALGGSTLYAGGQFTLASGQQRFGLAALPTTTPLSNNANLFSLTPSNGGLFPSFSSAQTQYAVTVSNAISAISFTATTVNSGATITLNGAAISSGVASTPSPLTVGTNTFRILVRAEDGVTQREYTVAVLRLSPDAVALSIGIERLASTMDRSGNETRHYRISVANIGQQSANGVALNVPAPTALADVVWACTSPTACTPASGANAVATGFDLGSGQSATIELSGDVTAGAAFVDISARAGTASGGGSNAQSSISESANGIGVMKSGFED